MRGIFLEVLGLALLAGLSSCDDEVIVANGQGDAFIISRVEGQDTVFGLALHGFGNKDFKSVSAVDGENTSYKLSSYNGYTYDYYYETAENDFTKDLPYLGNYNFSFTFTTAETDDDTDVLSDDVIYPANITKCEYNTDDEQIELGWDEMSDADFIVIYLEDAEGNTVFVSKSLSGSKTSYNISDSTDSWGNYTPESGSTYKVLICAYMYEADNQEDLNIQSKSIATSTVVWGE